MSSLKIVLVEASGHWIEMHVDPKFPTPAYVHRCLGADEVTIVGSIEERDNKCVHVLADLHKVQSFDERPISRSNLPSLLRFINEKELIPPLLFTRIDATNDTAVELLDFTGRDYENYMSGRSKSDYSAAD